jgi:opacity protein-like surface antigen
MKKTFIGGMAAAIVMLFLSAGSVFAADEIGFYVGLSGGYVIPQTMTISDPDTGDKILDASLNNGYLLGIKTGWNTPFTRRIMAIEMEYNYINNDWDKNKVIGGYTYDGNMSIHALLFNFKARYPEGMIHPYAGFGLGYAYTIVGDLTERSGGIVTDNINGSSGGAFCWQLITGVDVDLAPNLSLGVGYKYFATKPTIGDRHKDEIYADLDYRASIVTLGVTFKF